MVLVSLIHPRGVFKVFDTCETSMCIFNNYMPTLYLFFYKLNSSFLSSIDACVSSNLRAHLFVGVDPTIQISIMINYSILGDLGPIN